MSSAGNYRGLQSDIIKGLEIVDVMDGIYYSYDKSQMLIPGNEDRYFFHDQKAVYKELDGRLFSYSGPTSMGKSFVAQTYIIQQIESGAHRNFAILVPTKALINEVRGNLIEALKYKLRETNYRVVTNSGDIALKQSHYFVFVMTPERMNYMLTERQDLSLSFLFVDEAHKISEKSGRAAYYWKILEQLARRGNFPTVIFASPNTPNPELYFDLVPEEYRKGVKKIASKYSPVCQFKYFIDMVDRKMFYYDEHVSDYFEISRIHRIHRLPDIITRISGDSQSIIYCSSRQQVIDYAVEFGEFMYQAGSWSHPRRVVFKVEKPTNQLVHMFTFIVTTMEAEPYQIIQFYCGRGKMENFIKEGKNGFDFSSVSSHSKVVNANRLRVHMLAYNLFNWFRRLALSASMRKQRIDTIRLKLLKVAAKAVHSARYTIFKLCSSCPYKQEFYETLHNIWQLQPQLE